MSEKILKYPGSKGNIVKELVKLVPTHKVYLEPFFGGGSLFFAKNPAPIETINDIDSDVVNLFKVIRSEPIPLAKMLIATPYSREVYNNSYEISENDSAVEKAVNFLVRCWQGYASRGCSAKVGFKTDVSKREKMYALWDWYSLPQRVIDVADRLRKVQIEHRPALELIRLYDNTDTFMYLDPPYLFETRTKSNAGRQYHYEMNDHEHEELLKLITQSKAKIMISGYESEMYNLYLDSWHKKSFTSCSEKGQPRKEIIWMNYADSRQMTLDDFL